LPAGRRGSGPAATKRRRARATAEFTDGDTARQPRRPTEASRSPAPAPSRAAGGGGQRAPHAARTRVLRPQYGPVARAASVGLRPAHPAARAGRNRPGHGRNAVPAQRPRSPHAARPESRSPPTSRRIDEPIRQRTRRSVARRIVRDGLRRRSRSRNAGAVIGDIAAHRRPPTDSPPKKHFLGGTSGLIPGGLMRRWLRRGDRFWADRAAALAYRAELQRGGRPTDPAGQAKQVVSGTHLPASIAASITATTATARSALPHSSRPRQKPSADDARTGAPQQR
jgi:hypothetical protein